MSLHQILDSMKLLIDQITLSDHIIMSNQLIQINIGSLQTSLVSEVHGYEERIAQLEQGGHIFKSFLFFSLCKEWKKKGFDLITCNQWMF